MNLYFSLSAYILSLLLALVLVITGKRRSGGWMKAALLMHGLFLLLFLLYRLLKDSFPAASPFHYSFLGFLCSGLVAGGLVLRSNIQRGAKLYFTLFFLTLLFFIYSPSRFAGLLTRGDLAADSPRRFLLYRNFFLEEQRTFLTNPGPPYTYKMVQQFGLFHKTIRRDIQLGQKPDSVKAIQPVINEGLVIRVYLPGDKSAGALSDSTDLRLSLTPENPDPIKRKPY